jgi:hypothetical protein
MTADEGYIVEFRSIGGSVKVTAVDLETGREVSMVGTPAVGTQELAQLAVRKLRYVLNKEGNET